MKIDIQSEQDNEGLSAVKERRLAAGQCPTCGQQLYTFKKRGICCCLMRGEPRKVPLSIPRLVERGQCLKCERRPNDSCTTFQSFETSSCWSDNGIPTSIAPPLDPIATFQMKREISLCSGSSLSREPSKQALHPPAAKQRIAQPSKSPISVSKLFSDTIRATERTAVYEGSYNNRGEKHGEGVMTWSNGDVFKGSFVNDKRRGHGTITFNGSNQDGGEYVGEWLDDKMHGSGTRRYRNGDMYAGTFVAGKRQGEGRFYFANGDLYCGKWNNNQMHGQGNYYFSSGVRFEGIFLFNKRNGKGKTQGTTGSIDIFQYINDERVGQGVRFDAKRTRAWRLIQIADGAVRQNGAAPLERRRITIPEAVSLVYEIENASNSYIEDLLTTRGGQITF